ncbi:ATP synthase F1 subunit delta [candidate division TA06 bacterium]|nr:ATP synthase F1 subunit delta [candidate division TA06 bacterium]
MKTIADAYAASLFEIAHAEGLLARVEKDLDHLKEVLRGQRNLLGFLKGSDTTPEGKRRAIAEIFGDPRSGQNGLSFITLNQLNLLIDQGREREILAMIEAFNSILSAERKKLTAVITTSIPLTEEESNKIEKDLSKATGRSVHLKTRVNEAILGGAIIQIGEKVIDGSIRRQLEELRKQMVK